MISSYRLVSCLVLAVTLCEFACNAPDRQGGNSGGGRLEREVSAIWTAADIGTDTAYQQVAPSHAPSRAIAPADLREVASSIAAGRRLRKWPNEVTFTCEDQRIRVSWTGEIANRFASHEAIKLFEAALAERGYRVLVKSSEIQEMVQRLGLSAKAIDYWAGSQQYHGYTRKVGQTEIAVLAEVADYTGGRGVQSGISYQWHVARPYRHPLPTLDEALAALPGWFRAPYLPPQFYEALAKEPITEYSAGHGTRVGFENNVKDSLVKSLEDNGFEYYREYEPREGVQKSWSRYSDDTFAHIVTFPDSRRVGFHCQTPQHKGEPRKGKRMALHPSLRLPRSKRPVLELDQLKFADPKLKQQTQLFQDLADGIDEEDWFVQRYKDTRYSSTARYVASWETSRETSNYFPKSKRPYRAVHIALNALEDANADEQLVSLNVGGKWVPLHGWGATVGYHSNSGGYASVGFVDQDDVTFRFDSAHRKVIHLTGNSVTVRARPDSDFSYEFKVRVPYDASPAAMAERRSRLFALFDSPENVRDAALADIAHLRRVATDQMTRLEGLTVTDLTRVGPEAPPLEMPPAEHPPPEAVQKALLDQVSKKLDLQEKLVRESYQEMYAAMTKALPLNQVELPLQASVTP